MARRLVITSSANPRVRALRQLARRASAELCLAEGLRSVGTAVAAGAEIRELFVTPALLRRDGVRRVVDRAEVRGARVIEVDSEAFDGLAATVVRPSTDLAALRVPRDALLAIAVGIERPGNLGTMVRTACAAAADGVVVADPCTDLYHPDVIRGSVGTVFAARPVAAATHDVLAWLRRRSFRIVATTPAGDVDYARGDYGGNVAIVVGSERHGLPDEWLAAADRRVAIPMHGAADSLNVAVASGVVLFQAVVDRGRARSSSYVNPTEEET